MTVHLISFFRLFTTILYLAFLGLVVLLLVSVFIAQANSSYDHVQGIARQMANYSSARLLTQTASLLLMLIPFLIYKVNSVLIIDTMYSYIARLHLCCLLSKWWSGYIVPLSLLSFVLQYLQKVKKRRKLRQNHVTSDTMTVSKNHQVSRDISHVSHTWVVCIMLYLDLACV